MAPFNPEAHARGNTGTGWVFLLSARGRALLSRGVMLWLAAPEQS
jgi:hypothetical protein